MPAPVTTAQEWDKVRKAFSTSIMVDTSLFSLAQNLESADWPIKNKEDTPAKYIDLDLEEALDMLALKGLGPEAFDRLVSILRETLAFDQPFGDMVSQVEASSSKDNSLLKNLGRLGVPESFPICFTGLDNDTKEFCRLEKLSTLGEFAVFAQNMSQNVIVGGDFRTLLNALSQSDEATLARYLPMRAGCKGLFLGEAIALGLKKLSPSMALALAQRAGAKLTPAQVQETQNISKQSLAAAESELRLRCSKMVAEIFTAELSDLQASSSKGVPIERYLTPIGDPLFEQIVADQLKPYLQSKADQALPAQEAKRGFWARLFGR